jgi:hypothetical protein
MRKNNMETKETEAQEDMDQTGTGKYFTQYVYGCRAKNKAEIAADAYCRALDGLLLPSKKKMDDLILDLKQHIAYINAQYSRCGDMRVGQWDTDLEPGCTSFHLSVEENLCFIHIYPVKKEIHPSYDNSKNS